MARVARVGDRTEGTCSCHPTPISVGGQIETGSPDTYVNGRAVARLGDTIRADCGHTAEIVSASATVFANKIQVARDGDRGEGCYSCTIIEGSDDTFTP